MCVCLSRQSTMSLPSPLRADAGTKVPSSSGGISFRLLGWSAWTESRTEPAAWRSWAGVEFDPGRPELESLPPGDVPMMLRRRASPEGRAALGAAAGLPHLDEARYVLSTRHGELSRTLSVIECLTRGEPPSPADFSMSVHHALVGLLSIGARNPKGHGAVSAGRESFCYGMLEAAACIAERPDEPVILIHYDERPQGAFAELFDNADSDGPLVVAFCLSGKASGSKVPVTLTMAPGTGAASSTNPVCDFIRFLLTGVPEAAYQGERIAWRWSRA